MRRLAEENGIDVAGLAEQLTSANELTPITVKSRRAGLERSTAALFVAFAMVAPEAVRDVRRVIILPRLHAKLSQGDAPADGTEAKTGPEVPAITREQLRQGVVHEIAGDDAIVILDDGTRKGRRVMPRARLRAAGVCREGDSFDIRVREIKLPGHGGVRVETDIVAGAGPWVADPVRPGFDAARFKAPA